MRVALVLLAACGGSATSSPPPANPEPPPAVAPAPAPAPTEKVTEAAVDQKMIATAIREVKPQLVACGDKAPTAKGTVKIHAKVDPDATVTVTIETAPDPALGECVAGVVRGAKFPKTVAGGSFAYPFVY